jgi:hypothetical protein
MDAVCHRCDRNAPIKVHEYRGISLVNQTAISGVQVLSGLRQSMPSRSIESCARVRHTVPSVACGQMNRPRSRRLANRHRPSPSNQRSLIMSPLRPRKTNTWPENGCCSSTVCTCALRPWKPRRRSVTPAAIQIFVPVRNSITCVGSPESSATGLDQHRTRR